MFLLLFDLALQLLFLVSHAFEQMLTLFLLNLYHADLEGILDLLSNPALLLSLNLLCGLKCGVLALDELLYARLLTLCFRFLLCVVLA